MSKLTLTKQPEDYWSFVLDNDIDNEILNARNDLLVIGTDCHFKTANGANIIQQQNIQPTDVTIIGSDTYNPADKHQLFSYLYLEGYFDWITAQAGTGGVNRFDELLDTFKYIGKDGMCVVVDETQLRLVAIPFYNVSKSIELTDMPQAIVGNQMLITDPLGTTYQYAPIPSTPETFLNSVGYFIYDDLITKTTPIPFSSNTQILITNDGQGDATDFSQSPFGVASVWDSDLNQMDFSDLSIGDTIDFRMRLDTTVSSNQEFKIILKNAIGSPNEIDNYIFTTISGKVSGLDSQTFGISFAISNQDFIDYPSKLYLISDGPGTITVYRFYFRILRKNINLVEIGAEGLDLKEDKINKRPIVGNETNSITYPSTKDVVDYVTIQGASTLDAVLNKGHESDQPILLQLDSDNYFGFFEPTLFSNGFQSNIQTLTGTTINSLFQQWITNTYYLLLQQSTSTDQTSVSLSMKSSGTWMKTYYQTLLDGNFTEYMLQIEYNDILIQKRTNTQTRQFRIKLDNLTSNVIVQAPTSNGNLALESYFDTKIGSLTTDSVSEGTNPSRFYFNEARVLATLLTGFNTIIQTPVISTDSILIAFGKLQAQIGNILTNKENISNKINDITGYESDLNHYLSASGIYNFVTNILSGYQSSLGFTPLDPANYLSELYAFPSAARQNLQIESYSNIGDNNYIYGDYFKNAIITSALTAVRTHTLPDLATADLNIGESVTIIDKIGTLSSSIYISLIPKSGQTINGTSTPILLKESFGIFVLKRTGATSWSYDDIHLSQIKITTSVNIDTSTKDSAGRSQGNKHNLIDNGTNAINFTINGCGDRPRSYGKLGTGAITFVQGSGRTLIQLTGTNLLNGAVGSTASLYSDGTTDYLSISNA